MNGSMNFLWNKRPSFEKGATVVEFALIVPLLLILLMAIIELGTLFWVNLTMQHAVREGARYAITGRLDLDPNPNPADRLRPAAVAEKIKLSSLGLYDSVVNDMVVTDPDGNVLAGFGGPGETLVIKLECAWPLLTPLIRPFFDGGTYNFQVSSTMRNENF
jgi:hypothetical protein